MTQPARSSWTLRTAVSSAFVLASSLACQAQSCALCYTQAAAEKQRFIDGLRHGIIVLVVPSVLVSSVMIFMGYRKRNTFVDRDRPDPEAW